MREARNPYLVLIFLSQVWEAVGASPGLDPILLYVNERWELCSDLLLGLGKTSPALITLVIRLANHHFYSI